MGLTVLPWCRYLGYGIEIITRLTLKEVNDVDLLERLIAVLFKQYHVENSEENLTPAEYFHGLTGKDITVTVFDKKGIDTDKSIDTEKEGAMGHGLACMRAVGNIASKAKIKLDENGRSILDGFTTPSTCSMFVGF